MKTLLALTYGVFTLFVLILAVKHLKKSTLTALALVIYIVTCAFGIIYLAYWDPYLPYLRNYSYDSPIKENDVVLLRQVGAQVLVLAIGLIVLVTPIYVKAGRESRTFFSRNRLGLISFVLLVASFFFFVKYFVYGPGLDILLNTRLIFSSPEEAVTARVLARHQLSLGQGAYAAYIASVVVFPTIAFLGRYYRMPMGNVFFIILAFGSLAYLIQTRQKTPLLAGILQYLAAFLFSQSNLDACNLSTLVGRFGLIGLVGGIILYIVNFGQSWGDALISTLGRIFLVPTLAESWWFLVIPDALDFTGTLTFFTIDIERIRDVAFWATGRVFSANASFVAVGWSASGFLGVALASIILFGSLKITDVLSLRLPDQLRFGLYFITLPAFMAMISGSIMDFYDKGGAVILLGIAVFYFCTTGCSRSGSKIKL
jgi:hypothetical protein